MHQQIDQPADTPRRVSHGSSRVEPTDGATRHPVRRQEQGTRPTRLGRTRLGRTRLGRTRLAAAVRDRGQATTEYALVMLGAALVGVLVIGWATSGGGASAINRLFKSVIDSVISNV